jgi:LysR family transcriptional regulator, nod-box dependent transcriptional activator
VNLSHFDLNLLRSLDVLLAERNVTRAAERLHVTQQAASSALQRLRTHFGDDLLLRVGRHLEPTPLALSLIVPVRDALLAAQTALDTKPIFDPAAARTTCRIAMSDYGLVVVLPHFLRLLNTAAPSVHCIVKPVTMRSFEQLDMGDFDFVMTAHDPRLYGSHRPGRRIRSVEMFEDDFVCVVDPAMIDISNGISLATYRKLRHNSAEFGEGVTTIVERAWNASGYEFDVAVVAPTFAALIFMLPGTSLIATTQRRLASTLAPRLGMAITECPLKLPRLQENLMWHERTDQSPAQIFYRDILRSAVHELTGNL